MHGSIPGAMQFGTTAATRSESNSSSDETTPLLAKQTGVAQATPAPAAMALSQASNTPTTDDLQAFLKDHVVDGGFRGGQLVYKLTGAIDEGMRTIGQDLVKQLPGIGVGLTKLPRALWDVARDDGTQDADPVRTLEASIDHIQYGIASAATLATLWGITRMTKFAMPATVAVGALVGAAIGQRRINRMAEMLQEGVAAASNRNG